MRRQYKTLGHQTKAKGGQEVVFSRMDDAFNRGSNLFFPEEELNMYIDELDSAISLLDQSFRNTHEECTYMEVVQKAKSRGDAFKARRHCLAEDLYQGLHSRGRPGL